jgi:hypothetical protein
MRNFLLEQGIRRIAIVDDDADWRFLMSKTVSRIGFTPYQAQGVYNKVSDLIKEVQENAEVALCDHFLQPGGYASFVGAEPVAELYKAKFPAVLVTRFLDQDNDIQIRPLRRWIPRPLSRDQATPDEIIQSLEICYKEFQGEFLPERIPCRTLVRVERLDPPKSPKYYDVTVPSWNPEHSVRVFVSNTPTPIPLAIRRNLGVGDYFIAKVNTGARRAEDLFFEDFEPAPDPLTEEELAQTDRS